MLARPHPLRFPPVDRAPSSWNRLDYLWGQEDLTVAWTEMIPSTEELSCRESSMLKLYPYVGPAHLAKLASSDTPRLRVDNAATLTTWAAKQSRTEAGEELTVTFVVLPDGLWVADRHSEHVACARGCPVYCAGEMTFELDRRRPSFEVVRVSNQSTGFCPEPESWPAVESALDAAGIPHPRGFSTEMIFRRCPKCASTNIVKDGWFVCGVCEAELPDEWNFDGSAAG